MKDGKLFLYQEDLQFLKAHNLSDFNRLLYKIGAKFEQRWKLQSKFIWEVQVKVCAINHTNIYNKRKLI